MQIKRPFLLFQLCMLTVTGALGQDQISTLSKSEHALHFKAGGNNAFLKDYQISRLHYQQQGLLYGLGYTKRKTNSILSASLDYHSIDLTTPVAKRFTFSGNHVANLKLDYLRKLKNFSPNLSLYFGVQYKLNFNYFNWLNQDSFTFLIAHGLAPVAQLEYTISEKHSLHSNLSVPLLSLVVRPPWSGYDPELEENLDKPLRLITNGPINSVNKYLSIDWMFCYNNQLNKSLSLQLEYRFQYQYLSGAKQVNYLQHQATVGLTKKF